MKKNHYMDTIRSRSLGVAIAGALLSSFAFSSCVKEEAVDPVVEQSFSADIAPCEGESPDTRSRITASGFETLVTNMTVAAYEYIASDGSNGGGNDVTDTPCRLAATKYMTSGFTSFTLPLRAGRRYRIYAFANVGDVRSACTESPTFSSAPFIVRPGTYAQMNSSGMPMYGYLASFVAGTDSPNVQLVRLFAKVNLSVSLDWSNASINDVYVKNLNGRICPTSSTYCKAASSSDLLSENEYQAGGGNKTGTYTFWIPVNRQGTVSGVTPATRTRNNSALSAIKDLASYVEVQASSTATGNGTALYQGTVIYRTYIGSNNSTNFDVVNNHQYNLTLNATTANLQPGVTPDGWQVEKSITKTENRYRFELTPATKTVTGGGTFTYSVNRYTDVYTNGVRTTTGTTATAVTDLTAFTWTTSNSSVATVADGVVTVNNYKGSCTITATHNTVSYDGVYVSATASVTAKKQTYQYWLDLDDGTDDSHTGSLIYGQTKTMRVRRHRDTYVNGTLTTSDSQLLTISASSATLYITDGNAHTDGSVPSSNSHIVTNNNVVTINNSTNVLSWAAEGGCFIEAYYESGSLKLWSKVPYDLTTSNLVKYGYRLVLSPNPTTLSVNASSSFTAKKYKDTYTNGVKTATDNTGTSVTVSSLVWTGTSPDSQQLGSSETASITCSNGTITRVANGSSSITIKAMYNLTSAEQSTAYNNQTYAVGSAVVNDKVETRYSLTLHPSSVTDAVVGNNRTFVARFRSHIYTNNVQTTANVTVDEVQTDANTTWSVAWASSSVTADINDYVILNGNRITYKKATTNNITVTATYSDDVGSGVQKSGQTKSGTATISGISDYLRYSYDLALSAPKTVINRYEYAQITATLTKTTWKRIYSGGSFRLSKASEETLSPSLLTWTTSNSSNVTVTGTSYGAYVRGVANNVSATITATYTIPSVDKPTSIDYNGSSFSNDGNATDLSKSITFYTTSQSQGINDGWDDGGSETP